VEAAFLGKPSVLLSPAIYSELGVSSLAYTDKELGSLLDTGEFLECDEARSNALKIGYFESSRWMENALSPETASQMGAGRYENLWRLLWSPWRRIQRLRRRVLFVSPFTRPSTWE
jgi:hypothetical protein